MTNYITSVGVQSVSITIASGATSNTATITAVGTGAFIIWQGCTASDTAALQDTLCRGELTNTTTVTTNRATSGSSQTAIVNAVIIDGDTTNLIKSVQSGTISISAASSGTATISAVTNTNTATQYLGLTVGTASTSYAAQLCVLSLSGTTVTATSQVSGTHVVGYCVIEFQGTALNSSTQNVSRNVSTSSGTSAAITITSVTANNTFLTFGGFNGSNGSDGSRDFQYSNLSAATTVTINWNTASLATRGYTCVVVEFIAGVLNQAVQRNTIALSAAASNTATITSSSAAAGFCNWLGNTTATTTLDPTTSLFKITQTNATTLTMTSNASASGTGSFEVVEFPAVAGGNNTLTETVTESDSYTAIATDAATYSETQTETDSSIASRTSAALGLTESQSESDVIAGSATGLTNLNETGTASDTHQGISSDIGLFTESNTESDTYSSTETQPGNSVTETVTESDAVSIAATLSSAVSETVAANDNYDSTVTSASKNCIFDNAIFDPVIFDVCPGATISSTTGSGDEIRRRRKYLEWLKRKKTRQRLRQAKLLKPEKARELAAISQITQRPPSDIQRQINEVLRQEELEGIALKIAKNYLIQIYLETAIIKKKEEQDEEDALFMMMM